MHAYSIDKKLRTKVAVGIFMLSMIVSLLLKQYCADTLEQIVIFLEKSEIKSLVELVEWFEVNPNILGISFWYAVISGLYDKWFWKCSLIKKWHEIPDLNGEWEGSLTTSYDGSTIPMKLEINQTWSEISFHSIYEKTGSESFSNVAAIYVAGNRGTEISFAFRNDSYNVQDGTPSYDGYNILQLTNDGSIKARYFNNRPNPDPRCKGGNKGTFQVKRISTPK